jgi:hypothetical protein
MKRRKLLLGISTIAGVGGILGSGAFSSVSAERTVSVAVANDNRAYLRMKPIPKAGISGDTVGRSETYGDAVSFTIPGDGPGENQDAEGVGVDSVYEFHDLMSVENQGTQPVEVYSSYNGNKLADLALVNDNGILRDDPPVLDTGDSINVGLYIDTHGSTTGEYDGEDRLSLTIVADQPDN